MSNSTAATLLTYIQGITKIDITSIGLPGVEQAMMLNVIDKANREYYQKFTLGGGEPRTDRTAETGGTLAADTTLNGAITTASTSIVLDSVTGYPTSGAGMVWQSLSPDFIEYTNISSLTLTGVTGIDYSHDDNSAFTILYALPTNFDSFRSADDSQDGVTVNGVPYTFTSGIPTSNQFSVYDNGTTKYLVFPKGLSGDYFVRYNKGPTSITSTSTVVDVPIGDEDFIVYRGVEHVFRTIGADPNKIIDARRMADKQLLDALKTRNVGKKLKSGRPYMVGGYRNRYPLNEAVNQFIF